MFEGSGEVAAIGGKDGHDGEDFGDAGGRGLVGPILWGSGFGRQAGRVGRGGYRLVN